MITEKDIKQFSKQCNEIFKQISRDVIGQKEVVENTVIAMIAGGNVLLEGVPGDKSDKPNNTPQPSNKPSTEGNGSYNANNQYIDGEHNYQDGLGDAKGNAQDSVNNNGNLTPGEGNIIGDYFDGISN